MSDKEIRIVRPKHKPPQRLWQYMIWGYTYNLGSSLHPKVNSKSWVAFVILGKNLASVSGEYHWNIGLTFIEGDQDNLSFCGGAIVSCEQDGYMCMYMYTSRYLQGICLLDRSFIAPRSIIVGSIINLSLSRLNPSAQFWVFVSDFPRGILRPMKVTEFIE